MSTAAGAQAPAGQLSSAAAGSGGAARRRGAVARIDPLLGGLLAAAAVLRFATLGHQSFWYDEAFTPVHVLRSGLGATLHGVVHTENSPPVWYLLAWLWSRAFGTGEVALRSLSALAGVGLVAVVWAIGREIATRRTAIVLAAIVAVNPLLVWYAQEARVYELYALTAALSLLLFLRAARRPTSAALAAWAAASVLAMATHYFAAFLVAPEAALLLWGSRTDRRGPRARALAVAAVALCGAALVPLIAAQGGHGTQWIGRWPLSDRLVAIPGYYLLGGQSSAFGHGLLLLCAVPILVSVGLLSGLERDEWQRVGLMLALGALGILVPLVLIAFGADYLAPRNLIAAWVPLTAALALVLTSRRAGRAGAVLAGLVCLAGLAIVLTIDARPRYQRGDWRGVARVLRSGAPDRAIVTVELGSAPLEYYLPGLRPLAPSRAAGVSEIDLVGYAPLRAGAARPPARGFRLAEHVTVHGLVVYRFTSPRPQALPEPLLRARTITATRSETLVPAGVQAPRGVAVAA
jgi:4-amino-4-deoxy-L-arabinose transferase-like glycosyltransferase